MVARVQSEQKIKKIMEQIKERVISNSFEGARECVRGHLVRCFLKQEDLQSCLDEINHAEKEFRRSGQLLFWKWWVIFFVAAMVGAVAS
jgi:hypothetical protein